MNVKQNARRWDWARAVFCATLIGFAGLLLSSSAFAAAGSDGDAKMRVLVDKVLMAANDWVMTGEHVREIATAGFNVLSPRRGNDDLDEVRRIAGLAQDNGMRHMPWMRGTLLVPEDEPADSGKRLVWADGTQQDLYSPNADELWDWMTTRILGYARVSVDQPALMGVFLDFENYAPGGQSNTYALSYDSAILSQFARASNIEVNKARDDVVGVPLEGAVDADE